MSVVEEEEEEEADAAVGGAADEDVDDVKLEETRRAITREVVIWLTCGGLLRCQSNRSSFRFLGQ
jgi:hypothetical protein